MDSLAEDRARVAYSLTQGEGGVDLGGGQVKRKCCVLILKRKEKQTDEQRYSYHYRPITGREKRGQIGWVGEVAGLSALQCSIHESNNWAPRKNDSSQKRGKNTR